MCSTTNTVHVEPSVHMIEWLWDLEWLPGVRRTLHSPLSKEIKES